MFTTGVGIMSIQGDLDNLEKRAAERAAQGQGLSGADKVEAAGVMLQAVGVIIMCVLAIIVLGVMVYACAA